MKKNNIERMVAEEQGVPLAIVKKVMKGYFKQVKGYLKENEKVTISGFGTFKSRTVRERTRRNPQTGEPVFVGESRVVKFKCSRNFFKETKNVRDSGRKDHQH